MSNIVSAGNSRRFDNIFVAADQAIHQAPLVAEAIVPDMVPELEAGEVLPDLALVLKLLSRGLKKVSRQLDDGDNRRKHIKNVERQQKEVLEQATDKLRVALADVRYALDRTLSEKQAKAVFEGRSALGKLRTPVIERVSTRLLNLLADPKFGWEELEDQGYRATAAAARVRLQNALAEFEEARLGGLPERHDLLTAQGEFERDLEEKQKRLKRLSRLLRGVFEGVGFEREAAALVLRRRASPKQPEMEPPKADDGAGKVLAAVVSTAALPGVPALPAPAVPLAAAVPPVRRKRHRSRRRSNKARKGLAPAPARPTKA
jgi:hypothetical protein